MTRETVSVTPTRTSVLSYVPHGTYGAQANANLSCVSFEDRRYLITETQRGRMNDNDCYHRKIDHVRPTQVVSHSQSLNGVSTTQPNYWTISYDNPNHFWDYRFRQSGSPPTPNFGSHGITDLSYNSGDPLNSLNVQEYIDASMAYMLPNAKPEVSIINSIIELKDFKSLPKSIERINRFVATLPTWVRKATRQKATLRELTKLSSEAYLTHQFAIAPLLSEITAVKRMMTDVRKKVSTLLDNAGRIQYRHFSAPLNTSIVPVLDSSASVVESNTGTAVYRRVSRPIGTPMFRASLKYSYIINTPLEELMKSAVLDYLGVSLNPQIIWNALPWSFVVDWVVGVSRWLGQFNSTNVSLTTAIHRFSYSVKWTRYVECSTRFHTCQQTLGETTNQYRYDDVYSRRAAEPDLTRHLTLSGLNLKEFSYVGALIGVRV
jgi:hypothetical protein